MYAGHEGVTSIDYRRDWLISGTFITICAGIRCLALRNQLDQRPILRELRIQQGRPHRLEFAQPHSHGERARLVGSAHQVRGVGEHRIRERLHAAAVRDQRVVLRDVLAGGGVAQQPHRLLRRRRRAAHVPGAAGVGGGRCVTLPMRGSGAGSAGNAPAATARPDESGIVSRSIGSCRRCVAGRPRRTLGPSLAR